VEVCLVIGLSASTALFLPVSTPPNAIAYSTGLIEQRDFRLGGMLVGVLGPALIIAWVLAVGAMFQAGDAGIAASLAGASREMSISATPPPRAVELTFHTTCPSRSLRPRSMASSTCP
jgi:hypothetical protein